MNKPDNHYSSEEIRKRALAGIRKGETPTRADVRQTQSETYHKLLSEGKNSEEALRLAYQSAMNRYVDAGNPASVIKMDARPATLDRANLQRKPFEHPILICGSWFYENKPLNVTPSMLVEIVRNYQQDMVDVPIDLQHNSESDNPAANSQPAVGWVSNLRISNNTLFGTYALNAIGWNHVAVEGFKYISPAFSTNSKDRYTGKDRGAFLSSVALVLVPFLRELPPLI